MTPNLRTLVRETSLEPSDFIAPLFVVHGSGIREEIKTMPGQYRLSVDELVKECEGLYRVGVLSVMLFGIPEHKDHTGSEAYSHNGIVQQGIRALKAALPDLIVIADICMCEYTDHGHCGILHDHYTVDNDATLPYLCRQAVSFAEAGADIVAPSDMMDGRIADSAPSFGDRRSYQMDPANIREAMREIEGDIAEGADIVMVKPALPYLDVIRWARDRYDLPLAAYQVSGEYAMIQAAGLNGWIDRERIMMESLLSIKRAGADLILTYFAREAAELLRC